MKAQPYYPDPYNGEVYATQAFEHSFVDGMEIETPRGFAVVHMSRSGDSAAINGGYKTMAEAQVAAMQQAIHRNAVYVP
jgi:hypothetical protein